MLHDWLLFLHILSAVVYIGGAVAVTVQATAAAEMPRQFLRMADLAGRAIGIGAALTLVTGIGLVLEGGYGFSTTFVLVGIGAILIAGAVEGMYSSRKMKAAKAAIEDDEGANASSVGESLRQVMMVNVGVLALLVFAIWAMVFKPGV